MPSAPNQRLVSLDALRGFTMFWLIGGREFVLATVEFLWPAWLDEVETQLTHPIWQGYVAWDVVMPMFLFLVGTSLPFALAKRIDAGNAPWLAYLRILRRVVVLWLLGFLSQMVKHAEGMELYSNTLQAIAIGYLVTSLALLRFRLRGQIVLLAILVLGYGALLMFVPFGSHPGGTMFRTANLPRYVDELILGVYRRDSSFTWVITSLGFSGTVLLGAMAGHLLRAQLTDRTKMSLLLAIGLTCMAAGWLWSLWLPLNRHTWTSSMILWAGGISFVSLAASYGLIDAAGYRRWCFPLVVIGANALLAYILDPLVGPLGDKVVMLVVPKCPSPYLELFSSSLEITFLWLFLWRLYRRRLFFRA